jgi:U3 small nucleolar RNA-associated protein MPP10
VECRRLWDPKKAAQRKTRKEKLADKRLLSRLQPGLGLNNPYKKCKICKELSVTCSKGRVTTDKSGKKFFK